MSNHESFLKMIGLEKEFDPPKEEESKSSSSWTALMPGHENSKPEEPIGSSPEEISAQVESPWEESPAPQEEPALVAQDDWGSAEEGRAPEESNSQSDSGTEWAFEKTESYRSEGTPTSSLTEPDTERTAVYSELEKSRISDNRLKTGTVSKAMTLSQAFSQTGRTGSTASAQQTRKTVPFNYETHQSPEGAGDGTAHFDYSAQQSDYRIVTLEGRVSAQAFHLGNLPLRIGRDPTNDVVLDDVNSSRFHAEIRDQGGHMTVVDLGSTNGVKVNGGLVSEKTLSQHDVIQVGDCLFEFLPPGVLSKGAPQAAVFSTTTHGVAPATRTKKRRHLLWMAGAMILVATGYFVITSNGQKAADAVKNLAAEKAKEELEGIRAELESKSKRPISEMNPEDVKEAFLSHFKDSELMKFLPLEAQSQLTNLPPEILQLFVQDPNLLSEVISRGADQRAVALVLKNRIGSLVVQKRHVDALALSEIVLKIAPEDVGLKEARDRLAVLVESKSRDATGFTDAEKKFFEYMEQHENFVMQLMDEKRLDDALKFSEVVAKNIGVLLEQDKSFVRVGQEEKEKWEQRARDLRSKIEERDAKTKATEKGQSEGDQMISQIKEHMNFGEVGKANALMAEFLEEFPKHPQREEVIALKAQMEASVERSFESTRSAIEQLLDTESYENAWKELYRFMDLMPAHERAKSLRELIEKKTGARAVQYYNQARVYEFEADDLVAAEQYYKRTLEIADPRSDLAQKANRRYAEVKRRSIQ